MRGGYGLLRKTPYTFLATVSTVVVIFDQLTKNWIQSTLDLWEARSVISGFLNLVYYMNKGAAFGFLNRDDMNWQPYFFLLASVLAIILILYLARSKEYQDSLSRLGLGLLLGGAVGNMIDRVRFGAVVDFLDFFINGHHWPAFNVADMAICTGTACLLVTLYQRKRHASGSH